jgi:hypothetical protein
MVHILSKNRFVCQLHLILSVYLPTVLYAVLSIGDDRNSHNFIKIIHIYLFCSVPMLLIVLMFFWRTS